MGVLRLSHIEVGVDDLELCAAYYVEVVGMVEVLRESKRVFLKCWDEEDHHSLVLRESPDPGLVHIAFKVEAEKDLEDLEKAVEKQGCAVERVPAGEEPGQGGAVRFEAPTGHRVELVNEMERVGRMLPKKNPHRIHWGSSAYIRRASTECI